MGGASDSGASTTETRVRRYRAASTRGQEQGRFRNGERTLWAGLFYMTNATLILLCIGWGVWEVFRDK